MIYSRTARKDDPIGLEDLLAKYMGMAKDEGDYEISPYKFWDYALALKIIESVLPYKYNNVLNLTSSGPDVVFQNIIKNQGTTNFTQINLKEVKDLPIRNNKFDLISILGVLEHNTNVMPFIEKISKHVKLDGILLITTDELTSDKYKNNIINIEELLEISVVLEELGYDFVSDEEQVVEYNYNAKTVHSLVMKRIGK